MCTYGISSNCRWQSQRSTDTCSTLTALFSGGRSAPQKQHQVLSAGSCQDQDQEPHILSRMTFWTRPAGIDPQLNPGSGSAPGHAVPFSKSHCSCSRWVWVALCLNVFSTVLQHVQEDLRLQVWCGQVAAALHLKPVQAAHGAISQEGAAINRAVPITA
jgi:hypothetical protein